MTRENKLALIVGFGLVLTVGILVSDHFSKARERDQADLGGFDQQAHHESLDHPDLIEYEQPQRNSGQMLSNTDTIEHSDRDRTLDQDRDQRDRPRAERNQTRSDNDGPVTTFEFHDVRSRETLTSVVDSFYGTRDYTLVLALATYNGLPDPDKVREGMRLRIPHELNGRRVGGGQVAPMQRQDERATTSDRAETYTVRSGDTLSEIAEETMGSSRHWRRLFDHNSDVIDDPDNVKEGTVLRIPS